MSPTSSSTGTSSCRSRTSPSSIARAGATRREPDWPPRGLDELDRGRPPDDEDDELASAARSAARNVLKAWLLVAASRRASSRASAGCSAASAARPSSCSARCSVRPARTGRRPRAARDARRAPVRARRGSDAPLDGRPDRRAARDRAAEACLIDDSFPRAFVVGRGPRSATARGQRRPAAALAASRARGGDRPRARPRPHARRAHADVRCLLAAMLVEASRIGGFLSRLLLACSRRSARRSPISCSRRSASSRADRAAAAAGDPHVWPTR